MDNEELIIQRAAGGDGQAFRWIVEKYQIFVFNICLNVVKDIQHAENIAQETFLKAYRSLYLYELKGFKTWLGKIALNKALDYQRKLNSQKKRESNILEEVEPYVAAEEDSMAEELTKKEDRKKIILLCNQLPDIYKDIVKKHYIYEKCYAEIALEEGISIKTVESRLYRARKLLKSKWEEDEQ
jgi:RNA polymerase sigma factor (sigma-70 family)